MSLSTTVRERCACSQLRAAGQQEVTVIGGGPVGLLAARTVAGQGRRVLILEAGGSASVLGGGAEWTDEASGLDLPGALGRGLGGTAAWWGGQCVTPPPGDDDAEPSRGDVGWPVSFEDLSPWCDAALLETGLSPRLTEAARTRMTTRLGAAFPSFQAWPTVYMPRHRLDQTWVPAVARSNKVSIVTSVQAIAIRPAPQGLVISTCCEEDVPPVVEFRWRSS